MNSTRSGSRSALYDCIVAKAAAILNLAQRLNLRLMTETEQNEMEMRNIGKTDPGEQISIVIQDQVSLPVHPSSGPPSQNYQAQQTARIIGNNVARLTSQTAQQQPTAAAADAERQAQDQELVKYAISIALGLMAISATFLGAMLVPAIQHKFLFKAFISLSLASFVSAVFLLLLPALGGPFSSALVKIVKLTMFIAIGFIVSAVVCAFFVISAELNSDS